MYKATHRKKHILIIDDEKSLSQMLSMILETKGYQVQLAYTGQQALQEATSDFDLIILDLILPDINGLEICRRLKEENNTRHIPIIILSASSFMEDKIEGLYLGADDYLAKPCENEELVARMEAVMRRRSHKRERLFVKHQGNVVSELRRILEQALIVPYFQPIYTLSPFRFYGLEILSRPKTQTELARPDVFFKAALEYGLYTDLELLCWSMALNAVGDLIQSHKLFFNCNPYLLETVRANVIERLFQKGGIGMQNVVFEITERSAITNFRLFYERLYQYRSSGFTFAVDDVGGGYASLESIVEIHPEVVKIDKSLIRLCGQDPFKQSVIKFIVGLCQENGIFSVAEGIECREDLEVVKALGVDAAQGYFLYKPTPLIKLDEFHSVSF